MLSHSGFVWVNCGGMTSFGYVTPRTPGAIWTMSASPMNTRKITSPATAVLLAKERECRPPTDAFEREDIFDDDRAAEETGHEVAVRGHGRKQRVLLRMEVVDEPLGHALRPRESDVVLLEHFEHRGAKDSDDA